MKIVFWPYFDNRLSWEMEVDFPEGVFSEHSDYTFWLFPSEDHSYLLNDSNEEFSHEFAKLLGAEVDPNNHNRLIISEEQKTILRLQACSSLRRV